MAHEDYKEMLPALALSALDSGEAQALHQHLAECVECRRELADWENTAAAMSLTVDPAEPSSDVRDRIMDAVRRDKQSSPQDGRVVQFPNAQRRADWTALGRVGAIAATILCGVLIIWIFVLWQQNRELRRQNETLASDARWMEEQSRRAHDFVEILGLPGAKVTTLSGSGPALEARGRFVYARSGEAMLLTYGLPPSPAGKEYQLWFIVGKKPPMPGRTFTPDNSGRAALKDEVPPEALDSAVFAITLEPAGGVTAPTGAIYLRSSL